MIDLQLPHPLLEPKLWPTGEAMMSIFSLGLGGAFIARRGKTFVVPETFWSLEAVSEPSLVAILRDLRGSDLEIVSRIELSSEEQEAWRVAGASRFRVDVDLHTPSLHEWSREVFPQAFIEAGEMTWMRELREYEMQLGGGVASLDRLRFWPAFLRSRKMVFASAAAVEWAKAQALFSPQDDTRGEGTFALMNPTLQVVTAQDRMLAFWRADGELHSHELDWQQAAIIDELRETPRLPRAALLQELSSREFTLKKRAPFDTVVADLIQDGVILLR
jgi:hypothetical protein